MRDVGWTLIDHFQRLGFDHESQKFLVRFSLQNDGFSIKTIVKKDFIRRHFCKAFVTKDQTIVNITDVPNEQMVVGYDVAKGSGPNLLETTMRHNAGERGLPMGLPRR